jgi:transposase
MAAASPSAPPAWPPGPQRAPTASACAPYRELIELALARGRNAMAIWRDLVDDHGFPAQYASVRRFVVTLRGQRTPEAHPVIVTAPGEEGQVDYDDGPMVRDPVTGKYRRTRLFLFTLGYSRKSVRLLTFASSTRRWCELHEESFRRLGGTVQVVVLDNLREGVLTPDIYDPALNPLYPDVLAHYGVVALPCRVGDPDRKGKVDSAIGHTQAALKGLRFETLEAAQASLDRRDARWADTRIHGTTKRQVAAMFAEERPTLRPLPVEPFRYYQFGTRTVHLDGCIEGGVRLLWRSARLARPRGRGPWNASHVRLLDPATGQLLREHRRQAARGRHTIHPEDLPTRTPPTTVTLLARAAGAGTHIGTLCTLRVRAETTKNRRARVVPYSAATGILLQGYLAHRRALSPARGLLFLSESRRNRTQPITLWTWSKVIRTLAVRAGLSRFSTHTPRHLCLTDLARSTRNFRYGPISRLPRRPLSEPHSQQPTIPPIRNS